MAAKLKQPLHNSTTPATTKTFALSASLAAKICVLGGPLLLLGCSFVRFEPSPYTPRGLHAVYSAQEDLTFFVWRLRPEARQERVRFELYIDGDHRPIDLQDAPFPHEPFNCDRLYTCFQYQLPGKWTPPPTQIAPLLAVEKRHGSFHSPPARYQEVQKTFEVDPIPIDNNAQALPALKDWFQDQEIPLKRSFQWTLSDLSGAQDQPCGPTESAQWSPLKDEVPLPQDWTPNAPCFTLRPIRADRPGAQASARLIPAPLLYTQRLQTQLPIIDHPTILAVLVDLQVTNKGRCHRIVDQITGAIYTELDKQRVPYEDLGIFRPLQGDQEDSGCAQDPNSRYPTDLILDEARRLRASMREDATLLLIYLNNIELPPSDLKLERLQQIEQIRSDDEGFTLYTWSIGSNLINNFWPWDLTTPWAPIEDRNFLPSIKAAITHRLPLRTTDLPDEGWHLELPKPNASQTPQFFKICSFSPSIISLELPGPQLAWSDFDRPRQWPQDQGPRLTIDLQEQTFVPYNRYRPVDYSGVYEVCDDFCDNHFVGPDGTRYNSWFHTQGICQWR